jgi:predicted ATP-grasp superfamily ATP-dependent carboligase
MTKAFEHRKRDTYPLFRKTAVPGEMKILVIGISVRAMVESAVHSGYPVVALDAFGDQDLRAMAESHALQRDFHIPYSQGALFDTGRLLTFDAVAYTSNLENSPETLDRFAEDHRLIGNAPEVVRSVRHFPGLFSRLADAGFPVPETIFALSDREPDPNRRWLIKPIRSGGGHGISFSSELNLESRISNLESIFPGGRCMLQQYIAGKACSASFVANGRESVIIGITEQLIGLGQFGAKGFRYCGSILPLPEVLREDSGKTILQQVRRTAAFLTREYGLTGVNGFDFILNRDQVWLTEVNPRYSASMELVERAYLLPIFHLHMESVVEGRLPQFKLESQLNGGEFFGKSILFCERDSAVPEILDFSGADLRDIPPAGERLRKGNPVCTLLTGRQTYGETLDELIRQAVKIKERIYG